MVNVNEGGVITSVVIVGVVIAVSAVLIRLLICLRRKPREFIVADVFVITSLVVYLLQSALILWEIHDGLGRGVDDMSDTEVNTIQKISYAESVLFVLAVWLAKISTSCLLFRLSDRSLYRVISGGCIFFMFFTMAIGLAIITLTCNLRTPWLRFGPSGNTCMDMLYRWQAIAIADFITEAVLVSVSLIMIYPVQVSSSLKGLVILAFNQRLLLVIPISLRLYYLTTTFTMPYPSASAFEPVLCAEIEIMYAIIAAIIPSLPKFVTAKETYDVHYLPSKTAMDEENISVAQKALLKTKTSLANLRSLTPLFGSNQPVPDDSKTIRFVPVNIYELDNTAAMLTTLPPRDPPKLGLSRIADDRSKVAPAPMNLDAAGHIGTHTRRRRYTIEHDDRVITLPARRYPSEDQIAMAL